MQAVQGERPWTSNCVWTPLPPQKKPTTVLTNKQHLNLLLRSNTFSTKNHGFGFMVLKGRTVPSPQVVQIPSASAAPWNSWRYGPASGPCRTGWSTRSPSKSRTDRPNFTLLIWTYVIPQWFKWCLAARTGLWLWHLLFDLLNSGRVALLNIAQIRV